MKKQLLSLLGLAFMAVAANAQTWTAPVPKMQDGPVSKTQMLLYNVDANQFLSGGGYWGTQAILSDHASEYLLTDSVDAEGTKLGWTIQMADSTVLHRNGSIFVGKYAFNDGASMYQDMADQGHNFWSFEKQDGTGYYRIRNHASDAVYGSGETALGAMYDYNWFGHVSTTTDNTCVTTADPTNTEYTSQVDWAFVDPAEFDAWNAKKALYAALVEAEALEFTVDYAAESAVYNNAAATNEELLAAAAALKEKIQLAKVYGVLEGASEDNPKDATSLLVNPNFDGNADGWTNTFISGTNASNVGYQAASYTNGDVTISNFIEAWTNQNYGGAPRSIGAGELSQTLPSLPAGKYMLSVDVIAVNQDGIATVGVQLFAKGGDIENVREVATGNEKPEHFDVTFVSAGGDITMGLRTVENATANWIAADNFHLMYYGETSEDPQQVALKALIDEYNAKYPEADDVEAPQTLIDAYKVALEAAQNATENFAEYREALMQAFAEMENGVHVYSNALAAITTIGTTINVAEENGWGELVDNLSELEEQLQQAWENKEMTLEDAADINKKKATLIGEYISANAKEGDDVTILLSNPGFDTDFSGWTVAEGSSTPAWGGFSWAGYVLINDVEGGVQPSTDLGSGNAELYHAKLDISQTVHNMPAGLYTLSCQAFSRDDNGDGIAAELYAVMNGEEQTVKVKALTSEGAPEALFITTTGGQDGQSDLQNGPDDTWIPNGMTGANVYFSKGYYKNEFNILVTEPTDITVGIRDASGADWVLFDDFKLVYQGNSANAYAATINDLIAKLNDKQNEGVLTLDVVDEIDALCVKAQDAVDANDADACIAAIRELEEMIVHADENLKLTVELENDWNNTNENLLLMVESSYEGLTALVEEIGAKIDEGVYETEQQVKDYIYNLQAEWVKHVQYDVLATANEAEPADITPAILNPSGVDPMGNATKAKWDDTAGVGLGAGCTEMFNKEVGASFTQTIKGLAPGWYRLGVQGFYRGHGWADQIDANDVDTIPYYADIVAGEKATRLRSLKSDAEAYNALVAGAVEGKWLVPADMTAANNAFENSLYQNWLQFEVKEGEKEVTIGLVKTGHVGDDWTMFDNWTLYYLGTAAPAEDTTTAINGVAGAQTLGVKIYSVAGSQQSRLQKGVNIIKTTMSDGTVRTSKVLVK